MQCGSGTHADVDHLMIYDAFAHLPIYGLKVMGFVGRGEAVHFIRSGATSQGGTLPTNTRSMPTLACTACSRCWRQSASDLALSFPERTASLLLIGKGPSSSALNLKFDRLSKNRRSECEDVGMNEHLTHVGKVRNGPIGRHFLDRHALRQRRTEGVLNCVLRAINIGIGREVHAQMR